MTGTFECKACSKIFISEGKKYEWKDSFFGYCWKYIANCPDCKTECNEFLPPKEGKCDCAGGSCESCNCSCR